MKTFLNPLTTQEESEYLMQMASGNHEAKEKLVEHNMRLVAHVAKKYYNPEDEIPDLISIGTIGLLKAVDTYNSSKGSKLATYAARCIDNELLMYFRSKRKWAKDVSLYEPIGTDKEGNQIHLFDVIEEEEIDVVEKIELEQNIKKLQTMLPQLLDERELQIISLRYGLMEQEEITQREVAKKMHISRSYVSRLEKRALAKLKAVFIDI